MLLSLDTALLAVSYIFTPEAAEVPAEAPLVGRLATLIEPELLLLRLEI